MTAMHFDLVSELIQFVKWNELRVIVHGRHRFGGVNNDDYVAHTSTRQYMAQKQKQSDSTHPHMLLLCSLASVRALPCPPRQSARTSIKRLAIAVHSCGNRNAHRSTSADACYTRPGQEKDTTYT
jgi:hypothetical protein